jgi:hypothetical protein
VFPLVKHWLFLFGGKRPLDTSIGTGILFQDLGAFDELYRGWFGRGFKGWVGHWKGGAPVFLIARISCLAFTTKMVLSFRS